MEITNKAYYISPSGKLVEQTLSYTFTEEEGVLTNVSLKQEIQ